MALYLRWSESFVVIVNPGFLYKRILTALEVYVDFVVSFRLVSKFSFDPFCYSFLVNWAYDMIRNGFHFLR